MNISPDNCPSRYTASRIAAALGKSRQALHAALKEVPHSGHLSVAGGQAKAWTFDTLPIPLRAEVSERARRLGYRDADHLLAIPPKAWQPPIPLNETAPHCLEKADKLRRALAPVLARMNDLSSSDAELSAFGVQEYGRGFGHPISERHWRTLWDRTLKRDAGAERFDRLEIYLDDRLARKDRASVPAAVLQECHDLEKYLLSFKDPQNPTAGEQAMLWFQTFQKYEEGLAAGDPSGALKRRLCEFLLAKAPFIADTFAAVRKQFERKLQRWIDGGRLPAALTDKRVEAGLRRRKPLTEDDRNKIGGHAVLFCGKRVGQAYRELKHAGELSPDLIHNSSSKYYVPRRVRREWPKGYVNELHVQHIGGRQARNHRPTIIRDWSRAHSMDAVQGDDATPPIYTYVPDGQGWFRCIRGQFLPFIDVRSTRVLNFAFVLAESYHSLAIRSAITRLADLFGLPGSLYLEGGVWESSKLIKGHAPKNLAASDAEAEGALMNLGVHFVHARSPQAKVIEGVIGKLQNRMERFPGYCGREERKDLPEETRVALRKVSTRQLHPADYFLSPLQWINTLQAICEDYNQEPQQGKMLDGLSPDQAFEQYWNHDDPPIRLDATCRYLLAHEARPERVNKGEVRFTVGKVRYEYCSPDLLHLSGQNVLVWFNPEYPDLATITTLDRKNPLVVECKPAVPALDAPDALLSQEIARVNAPRRHARAIYRELRAAFQPTFRRNLVDRATADLGSEMQDQLAARETTLKQERKTLTRARRQATALNMALPPDVERRPEAAAALERLTELLEED
jgi:hypothetical protein